MGWAMIPGKWAKDENSRAASKMRDELLRQIFREMIWWS
jgi:hypothetical protein